MWEQNDRGGLPDRHRAGLNHVKTDGPLFRQFGAGATSAATDTLKYHSPGENAVDDNPTRVFPDMEQILANNTNAATGTCPTPPPAPTAPCRSPTRECFSEFLPTTDWVGFLGDRTMNFRLTARDSKPGGGGDRQRGDEAHGRAVRRARSGSRRRRSRRSSTAPRAQTITWDVAGTDVVADQRRQRQDQPDRRPRLTTVIADEHAQRRVLTGVVAERGAARQRADQGRGGRQRLLRRLRRRRHVGRRARRGRVGGTVPATLSLTLGTPAAFGAFTPGVTRDYDATSTANVISTAGDAALSVADPSATAPGHLVNGTFVMPSALQARAGTGAFATVSGAPATLKTYTGPVSNDAVTLGFRQHVDATDALRTGAYTKTLTFTLSTTTP